MLFEQMNGFAALKFTRSITRKIGGEGGIRTLDTLLTHTRFPSVRLQPLSHFSCKNLATNDSKFQPELTHLLRSRHHTIYRAPSAPYSATSPNFFGRRVTCGERRLTQGPAGFNKYKGR
jgi:hypothetical protein